MPNKWTGIGNPYTKQEVRDRLKKVLDQNKAIIGAGAGTGISAKFIEKGGADLIIIIIRPQALNKAGRPAARASQGIP